MAARDVFIPKRAWGQRLINRGTFALYRGSLIRDVLPAYVGETFCRRSIKLGDDTFLTQFSQCVDVRNNISSDIVRVAELRCLNLTERRGQSNFSPPHDPVGKMIPAGMIPQGLIGYLRHFFFQTS